MVGSMPAFFPQANSNKRKTANNNSFSNKHKKSKPMIKAFLSLTQKSIATSISKSLDFLHQNQLDYGEFKTYFSLDKAMMPGTCTFDSTPFTTTFVIFSISLIKAPRVSQMIQKAIQFLVEERKTGGVWRFWSSRSPKNKLCPPDLDDTACVAYALKKYYSPLVYSFLFGSNLKIFLNQRNEQGLFYTFIVPNLPRNPIDSAVNANVLLYLGECEETKPVCDYLNNLVLNNQEKGSDRYYSETALYYFMSRAYFHGASSLRKAQNAVVQRTLALQQENGSFGNDLNTALAVCTLLNYQHDDSVVLERAIHSMLERQGENGAWSKVPLWRATPEIVWGGEASDWSEGFWGSEELTTAFSIEALARYKQRLELKQY